MGRKAWANRRSGTCEACGTSVAAQAGWVYRDDAGSWKVCCKSAVCGTQLGLAGAAPEAAETRELTADGRVLMPYEKAALPLLRAMPGARFDRDASPKCWRVSLDPGDRDRLLELADELKLAVAPELRTVSEDIEALSKQLIADGLYPFQVKGVCWLRQRRRALLGDSMGLGKTIQVLFALPHPKGYGKNHAERSVSENVKSAQSRQGESSQGAAAECSAKSKSDDAEDSSDAGVARKGKRGHASCDAASRSAREASQRSEGESSRIQGGKRTASSSDSRVGGHFSGASGVREGATNTDERPRNGVASTDTLQGRFRPAGTEDRSGTGRSESLEQAPAGQGSEEDRNPGSTGLDGDPHPARAIVICPASLKLNWRDECKRWRPGLKPVVLSGRGSFRHPEAGEVIITNYDILPKLPRCTCKAHGQLKYVSGTWEWVCEKCSKKSNATVTIKADPVLDLSGKGIVVVADESTAVKNFKAIRSKVFKALAVTADKVWQLSGTPMLNRPFDLYGMLQSGDMAYEVFGGWRSFLRCFNGYKNRWGGYEFGEPLPETPERLRRVMLRRLKTEVLTDLPEVTYQTLTVNSLDKGLKAELDAAWSAWNDEAEALDGLADGAPADLPPFEQFSKLRAKLAASRINAMLDLVEQYEDNEQPLIVFSAHRAPIDTLAKREGWAVITGDTNAEARNEAVKRFQSGELKGIGLTIKAGGYGLTLTRGSHLLFVDLEWTPSANAQAEDRARRIGQTADSIQVTRMVSDHPLDQHVLRLLAEKTAMIFKAVEAEVQYKRAPKPKTAQPSGWVQESDADQQARKDAIEQAAKEAEKAQAQKRIDKIILQEKDRQGTAPGETLELTSEVRQALTDAFYFMKSVCDGAQEKDGQGFSKPDVYRTAFLASWMDTGEETAFRAAAMILCRYRRQLGKQFPILFKKAA